MPMIVSCGDGRTWLFHTGPRHGPWVRWTAGSEGIHLTSIGNPATIRWVITAKAADEYALVAQQLKRSQSRIHR